MEKIKVNKARITELKQAILDLKEDLEGKNRKIRAWEADNEKLMEELQKTKREAELTVGEKEELWQRLQQQENLLGELKQKIEEGKTKCA
jgi:chromosome segregation ATPase